MARFGKSSFLQHRYRRPAQRSLHPDPGFFVRRAPRPVAAAGVSKFVRFSSSPRLHRSPPRVAIRFRAGIALERSSGVISSPPMRSDVRWAAFPLRNRAQTAVGRVFGHVHEAKRPSREFSASFSTRNSRRASSPARKRRETHVLDIQIELVVMKLEVFGHARS